MGYILLSIGLVIWLKLPDIIPIPTFIGVVVGTILLFFSLGMMILSMITLDRTRASYFKQFKRSIIVTTGIYAYCRNPIYVSAVIFFLGLCLLFRSTAIGIMAMFYFAHFVGMAKWEEKELTKRFGIKYLNYKSCVPSFIPSRRSKKRQDWAIYESLKEKEQDHLIAASFADDFSLKKAYKIPIHLVEKYAKTCPRNVNLIHFNPDILKDAEIEDVTNIFR